MHYLNIKNQYLNILKLRGVFDFVVHSEQELLRDEVVSVKAVKDKLNTRVIELEEEMRKGRESIESYKQKSPSEEDVC